MRGNIAPPDEKTIYQSVIGIDPGKKGGIAVIDSNRKILYVNDFSSDREIIRMRLSDVLKYSNVLFLEKCISVGTNNKITNDLFFINGYITGVAEQVGIDVTRCNPMHWKKVMDVTSDKATSISLAIRLFPNCEEMMYAKGSYKDGIAEALLLAYYGMYLNRFYPETEQIRKKHRNKDKQRMLDI